MKKINQNKVFGSYIRELRIKNEIGQRELAKKIGPGKNIVTILCDSGSKYQTKLYNRNFLINNDLPCPEWL